MPNNEHYFRDPSKHMHVDLKRSMSKFDLRSRSREVNCNQSASCCISVNVLARDIGSTLGSSPASISILSKSGGKKTHLTLYYLK